MAVSVPEKPPAGIENVSDEVSDLFRRLLSDWARDTMMSSDSVAILMHRAHYGIIGIGPPALPLIFKDLAEGGGPWFVALQAITHRNLTSPENANDVRKLREDWLEWGRANGYLS